MALMDPRRIEGRKTAIIPLGQGLDMTTSPMFARPGTLSDCVNVEIVDDVLQNVEGGRVLGEQRFNKRPEEIYYLYGDDTSDFTMSSTFKQGEEVRWYTDDIVAGDAAGSGILIVQTLTSVPVNYTSGLSIAFVEGTPPTGYGLVVGQSSGDTVTIHSGPGFIIPDRYSDIIAQVVRQFNWAWYLGAVNGAGWDLFRPNPLGSGPVSHVFQLNDKTYCVRDYVKGKFIDGVEEPSIGDKITLSRGSGTDPVHRVKRAELTSGSWEAGDAVGWLYMYPASDTALDRTSTQYWLNSSAETITNNTTGNTLGTTPVQTSPATVDTEGAHGLLWALDTDTRKNTGWRYVDTGFTVEFDGGAVAPLSTESPVFVTDALDTVQSTGFVALTSPATEYPATGTYTAWSGLANLAADDASNAQSIPALLDYTRIVELTTTTDLIPGTSKIIGIEVAFEASQTVGADVQIAKVQLRNDATGATQYLSDDKGDYAALSVTPTEYTYGSQLDLWGFDTISQADINANDITVQIQFYNTNGAGTRTVDLDYVSINVHYLQNAQDVHFWNGTTDVDTGNLYAYQVHDGEWSSDDASGYMTVHDMSNPSLVIGGTEIRSAASGGGDLIAYAKVTEANIIPAYADMVGRNARCQSIETNIGGGEEVGKAFVANGVGPCFALDNNEIFQFIRTPVDRDKDRPRYLAELRDHLVLGLKEHVFVSSIATPNNFATYDGATTWALGDTVTGLVSTADNNVAILCQDSIHTLSGSSSSGEDQFRVSHHSSTGGAKHYSGAHLGDVVFLDDFGLGNFATTDRFGSFDQNQLNYGIESWLRPRLSKRTADGAVSWNGLLETMLVRGKNQLRSYFNDGWILTTTFPTPGSESGPKFTLQNYSWIGLTLTVVDGEGRQPTITDEYRPTCLSTSVASWGDERLYAGQEDGTVVTLDDGNAWLDKDILGGFTVHPIHANDPMDAGVKFIGAGLAYERDHMARLYMTYGLEYDDPPVPESTEAISGTNSLSDKYYNKYITATGDIFFSELASAVSLRVKFDTNLGEFRRPVKFLAISPKFSDKSTRKDNLQQGFDNRT